MRGEKPVNILHWLKKRGSPPRARGKDIIMLYFSMIGGITPACAGKRLSLISDVVTGRDHPRVRGEKTIFDAQKVNQRGSPPRARGKAGVFDRKVG